MSGVTDEMDALIAELRKYVPEASPEEKAMATFIMKLFNEGIVDSKQYGRNRSEEPDYDPSKPFKIVRKTLFRKPDTYWGYYIREKELKAAYELDVIKDKMSFKDLEKLMWTYFDKRHNHGYVVHAMSLQGIGRIFDIVPEMTDVNAIKERIKIRRGWGG